MKDPLSMIATGRLQYSLASTVTCLLLALPAFAQEWTFLSCDSRQLVGLAGPEPIAENTRYYRLQEGVYQFWNDIASEWSGNLCEIHQCAFKAKAFQVRPVADYCYTPSGIRNGLLEVDLDFKSGDHETRIYLCRPGYEPVLRYTTSRNCTITDRSEAH